MQKKNVAILGSTGSIGKQTLDVASWFPNDINITALTANTDIELMEQQCRRFKPTLAVMQDKQSADSLKIKLADTSIKVLSGIDGMIEAATILENDIVVTAVSGAVGIKPTLAAIKLGIRIALANKETLVAAGEIVMAEAKKYGAEIIPVDSEHSAIFQCLGHGNNVNKIILTASGGPFRGRQRSELLNITRENALKHPNWVMGAKISIDSATLMNKGLEVIEAYHLFNMPVERIDVVVHPQSIIHSMVEYKDGSIFAHLGKPDMRIPIQYAISFPERLSNNLESINFVKLASLTFEEPDFETFKALSLAYLALNKGGIIPAILNAANETAVNAFLHEQCSFLGIADIVEETIEMAHNIENPSLNDIIEADMWARRKVENILSR